MLPKFEQFIRERRYLQNVTPATVARYTQSLKWLQVELPDAHELKETVVPMREKGRNAGHLETTLGNQNAKV